MKFFGGTLAIKGKMNNSGMLALIKSNVSTCSRVPFVFMVSREHLKDINDVKFDVNGSFQKLLESKWKAMVFDSGEIVSVKVISNSEQKLKEKQILMKVNRSET